MTDREIAILAAKQFNTDEIISIEPYGSGHINSTWLSVHRSANGSEVKNLLQVSVLEALYVDESIRNELKKYMGFETEKIYNDVLKYFG